MLLGARLGHLGRILEHLIVVFGSLRGVLGLIFVAKGIQNEAFHLGWHFFINFCPICVQKPIPELRKTAKFHGKNNTFRLASDFNISSLPDLFLMPTWLHFGSKKPPKSRLGGLLEALGGLLGRLGSLLNAS